MKRHRRRQGGFTLVEAIVATILLALGISACLGAIGVSVRATAMGKEYSTASLLADRHFSEIQADPDLLNSGEQGGEFGAEYPAFRGASTWSRRTFRACSR